MIEVQRGRGLISTRLKRGAAVLLLATSGFACGPGLRDEAPKMVSPTPTLPALSPEVQAEINRIEAEMAKAKESRPDCYIEDVNFELKELAAGRDTYNPRQIKGTEGSSNTILELRQIRREMLEGSAKRILLTTGDRERRSLMLTEVYLNAVEIDLDSVRGLPRGSEFREELLDLADCGLVKVTSLIAEDAIRDLREGGDLTPRRPRTTPTFSTI